MSKEAAQDAAALRPISAGWRVVPLSQLGSGERPAVKAGPFGSSLKKEYYTKTGYKIYGQEQVIAGDPYCGGYYIDRARFESLRSCEVQPGDLLVSLVGTVGHVLLVPDDAEPGIINPRLVRLSMDRRAVCPEYVRHWLTSQAAQALIQRLAHGGTMGVINASILSRVPIPLPPLHEQRKIAEILDTWDEAITLTERLIEAKRRLKKGLMQQLLTGKRRFPEFEGRPWREVRLGELLAERKERGCDHLPLLAITSEQGIVQRDVLDRRDTSSANKQAYLRICPGDIGYNTMRMWQGRCAVSELEGIVSPAYTVCVPRPAVDSHFMGYLFGLPQVIDLFRRHSQGLVSDVWNLKFSALARIRVRTPELSEQQRISAVLASCDEQTTLLIRRLDVLEKQKRGLMQQLLMGRVRVPTATERPSSR